MCMKGLIYVAYFTSTERDLVTSIAQHVLANAGPGETEVRISVFY
jgi:hypothetical protein